MIPLTFLKDEYIGRQKLTAQKKLVEYIVPPQKRVGTMVSLDIITDENHNLISKRMKLMLTLFISLSNVNGRQWSSAPYNYET